MTKKIIIITGSALIGLITMLGIIFAMIATGAIQVEQKTIVFSSANAEAIYSGEALTSGNWEITSGELQEGHSAKVIVSGSQTFIGSSPNTISATIVDENGADVSDYYKIEYQPGTLKVFHRAIQVLANSATKAYDGSPLTCHQYTIASGELPAGHIIVPTYANTITDVGTTANNVSVIIKDAEGNDVTANYDVTTISGSLTVTKRPLYLQSESEVKTYDGTPLTCENYSILSGELVRGHDIEPVFSGSITNAGTVVNELTVTISDASGRDVTDNYDVRITNGSLTIVKNTLHFQSESVQKTYDALVYASTDVDLISGEIIDGHTLVVNILNSIINVGTVSNDFTVNIFDEYGTEVTDSYDIHYHPGTLTVLPVNLVISTASDEKFYNGAPLANSTWTIDQGAIPGGDVITVALNSSITTIGSVTNAALVSITNADGNDVTDNYTITLIEGTLTVKPVGLTLVSQDAFKDYDGTPLTNHTLDIHNLPDGYTVHPSFINSITNVGNVVNEFSAIIKDSDGNDVTSNFDITYVFGKLTVKHRYYAISSKSAYKTYDGKELTCHENTLLPGSVLPDGHRIEVEYTASITNIGSVRNTYIIRIFDAYGNDVTTNFDTSDSTCGTLSVSSAKLHLVSASGSKMYDGTPLIRNSVEFYEGSLPDNTFRLVYEITGSQTNVGSSSNTFTYYIIDGNGVDVTRNFDIDVSYGTLSVSKATIGLKSETVTKSYDGTPLEDQALYFIDTGKKVEGSDRYSDFKIIGYNTSTLTNVGTITNHFTYVILDKDDVDVTSNFNVDVSYGTLTVTHVKLNLYSKSDNRPYNGVALTNYGVYYIGTDTIVDGTEPIPGFTINYNMTGSQTEVGSSHNTFTYDIVDRNGVVVTSNFDIDVIYGELTVTTHKLGFYSLSVTKQYDGKALTAPGIFHASTGERVEDVDLGNGLRITYTVEGTQTDVGTSTNHFTFRIWDQNNQDVTENFDISIAYGTLTVTAVKLDFYSASATKTYDGTPLTSPQVYYLGTNDLVNSRAPIEGFTVECQITGSQTEEGSSENSFEIIIRDATGKDVTHNFSYTTVYGTLSVSKYKISLYSKDAYKVYDGSALTTPYIYCIGIEDPIDDYTNPIPGFKIVYQITATQTDVGTSRNTFTFHIIDGNNVDVTNNFDVVTTYGTLTVAPYKVDLYSNDASKVYDGTTLTSPGVFLVDTKEVVDYISVIPGHRIVYLMTGEQTEVGESNNTFDYYIVNGFGKDVTRNFDVNITYGTLTVSQYALSFYSKSATSIYDGTPLTSYGVYYVGTDDLVDGTSPIDGFNFSIRYQMNGTQTNAGQSSNTFDLSIIDENGHDVTYNFDIDIQYGTLTVNKRHYSITTKNISKAYDGTPLTNDGTHTVVEGSTLAPGHTAAVEYTGSRTEAGSSVNSFVLRMYDAQGNNVTSNYDQTLSTAGTLTVSRVSVKLTSQSAYKSYDGTPLTSYGVFYTDTNVSVDSTPPLNGFRVIYTMNSSQTDVGSSQNRFSYTIVNSDNVDVTSNFDVAVTYGTLTVSAVQLGFYSQSASKAYDGTPLTSPGIFYIGTNTRAEDADPLNGFHVVYQMTGTQTEVGSSRNSYTLSILDEDDVDVTRNFDIDLIQGTLTVSRTKINLYTNSANKTYDGTPLTSDGVFDTATNERVDLVDPVPGFHIVYQMTGEQTNVGLSNNTFTFSIVDDNGIDVTHNFEIDIEYGTLGVSAFKFALYSNDASKSYDGTPLTNSGVYCVDSNLPAEDYAPIKDYRVIYQMTGTQTDAGSSRNTYTFYIVDGEDKDVTSNFAVTSSYGTLTVTAPHVGLYSNSDTKTYDGTPLTKPGVFYVGTETSVEVADPLSGFHIVYQMTGTQTEAGSSSNSFMYSILDENDVDVTRNFDISVTFGTLTVSHFRFALYSDSASKTYDGTPLTMHGVFYVDTDISIEDADPLTGFRIVHEMTGTQTESGSSRNTFNFYILDENDVDVTHNFDVAVTYGTLTVAHAKIGLYTNSDTKIYDGSALTNYGVYNTETEDLIDGTEPVDGFRIVYQMTGEQTNAGSSENRFEYYILDGNNVDVTSNFDVEINFGTLTVSKRPYAVTTPDLSKPFDGTALESDNTFSVIEGSTLAPNDTVYVEYTGSQTNAGSSSNSITVLIYDRDGNNVTSNYDLSASVPGTLTVYPRKVSLYSVDAYKVYDGTPLTNYGVFYTETDASADAVEPLPGYRIVYQMTGSLTNAGSTNNTYTCYIVDANGVDATHNFDLDLNYGKLTVAPIKLNFYSNSAAKVYDGSKLVESGVYCVDTDVPVENFEPLTGYSVIYEMTGERTDVGYSDNYFTICILDGDGVDSTANFDITKNYGRLTVSPFVVALYTDSAAKVYDGTSLTQSGVYCVGNSVPVEDYEPLPGYSINYEMTGSQTNAGFSGNTFTFTVIDGAGNDATRNFSIDSNYGTLTVSPFKFTLYSTDASKAYDGTPLTQDGVYCVGTDVAAENFEPLPDYSVIYLMTGTQTDAGISKNTFNAYVIDPNGNDVTSNFEISKNFGTLTVSAVKVSLYTNSDTKMYDSTPLTNGGVYYLDTDMPVETQGPIDGYSIVYRMTGEQINAGSSSNRCEYYIVNSDNVDVTENFDITISYGTLTVTKRPYGVVTGDLSKPYDGTPLTNDGTHTVAEGSLLLSDHTATVEYTGSQTVAGSSDNTFKITIKDTAGNDVTPNYDQSISKRGKLTVYKVKLAICSASASKPYDGTPLTASEVFYSGTTTPVTDQAPIANHSIGFHTTGSQTNAGSSSNEFTFYILNGNGVDVTSCFDVEVSYGTLTVLPLSIGIYSMNDSKVYDGTALTNPGVYYIDSNKSVDEENYYDGFRVVYKMTGEQINAGSSSNYFTYTVVNSDNVDVSENFDVRVVYGTLTVTPRPYSVVTEDLSKPYDGTPLTNNGTHSLIGGSSLAPDHTAVVEYTGSQTEVGTSPNSVLICIYDKDGTPVTDNYDTSNQIIGTLRVTPIDLVCMSDDVTEFYSASLIAAEESDCSIIGGALLADHTIEFVPHAKSTDVCEKENEFYVIIRDKDGVAITENYNITYVFGKFTVLPREIKVITPSATHTYDGKEFSLQKYTIDSEYALVDGHTVARVTFSPNSVLTNVGTVKNKISSIVIKDAEGDDVTRNYLINYSEIGDITVTPRPLTIRTPDASKPYDGTALTAESWDLVSITQPLSTHTLQVRVSGTRTEVGSSPNIIGEVLITDNETGEYVTYNYAITQQLGTLTVKGQTSGSESGDSSDEGGSSGGESGSGGTLDDSGDLGGGASDDNSVCLRVYSTKSGPVYLRMKSYGNFDPTAKSWTEATSYDKLLDGKYSYNYLTGVALKNTGLNSTRIDIENYMDGQYFIPYFPDMYDANYTVQTSDVTYTGDPTNAYSLYYYLYSGYFTGITADLGEYADEELEYRENFVKKNYLYVDDDLRAYLQNIIDANGFNPSSSSIISDVATYIQNAADYNEKYNRAIDYAAHPIIAFLTEQEGVCRHYASAATALFRALGIPARYTVGFTGNTVSGQWTNITGKQAHAWTEVYIDGIGWLPVEVTGSSSDGTGGSSGAGGIGGIQGDSGSNGNTSGGGNHNTTDTPDIDDDIGDEEKETIKVSPVTTYYRYDGGYAYPQNEVVGLSSLLANGYTYSVKVEKIGDVTNLPGVYETHITDFALYDKNGNDVTEEHNIQFGIGYMQIYLKEITITTYGATKEYDGTPLTCDRYLIEGDLLTGHTLKSLECVGSQLNVGKKSNNFNISIVDANGIDVTDYYKINKVYGTLTVTPKTITITANSATKTYDGYAITDSGYTVEGDLDGYTIEVYVSGSQTTIGYSDNAVRGVKITDSLNRDVTLNFSIICINGKLSVTPATD